MDDNVTINGRSYRLGKLRCKHLRQISEILAKGSDKAPSFSDLDKWFPFILFSLKEYNPDITQETLDDMTLTEYNDAWTKIIAISGVELVAKGEALPRGQVGTQSTADSRVLSAGRTELPTNIH